MAGDTLRGTVHDQRGQPVANVRIDIATAAPKRFPSAACPSRYLDCLKSTRTNRDGRFEIEALDPTLRFRIASTAPDKLTCMSDLIDPATETATMVLLDFPSDVVAERIIEGTIVTAEGTPIPSWPWNPTGLNLLDNGGGFR